MSNKNFFCTKRKHLQLKSVGSDQNQAVFLKQNKLISNTLSAIECDQKTIRAPVLLLVNDFELILIAKTFLGGLSSDGRGK